ncbi:MAG: DUF2188 domain-containing protein [Hydrogenophaga sp.]|uniref:DUF2188 domain-containing protein n=1 Tax=Hydrogenophaga sp. TaxID=1904254 RepID=UPI0034571F50|nr:DUF2188 domain-containing protein [Hydrogenophaga sp.]
MQNYHIKPHDGHWDLTKEGAERASISKPTKAEILAATEEFMSERTGSVKIHLANGRIEEERTYPRSADPRRSKG